MMIERDVQKHAKKEQELFDPHQIAIATTTFYPKWAPLPDGAIRNKEDVDGVRGDLALTMLKEAKTKGFQVSLVDGGSSDIFRQTVAENLQISISDEEERGMSASRRQVFREAATLKGTKVIAWVEPEKISVTRDCLPEAALPILKGEADIVIPKRNETLFKQTYPDYQVDFEQRANERYNNLLRMTGLLSEDQESLDAWFGPRFIKNDPEVLKHFLKANTFDKDADSTVYKSVNPELWPDALFLPIPSALQAGLRVASVPVDYTHPAEQTAIEQDSEAFRAKRQNQYSGIIYSTIHHLKREVKEQESRLKEL